MVNHKVICEVGRDPYQTTSNVLEKLDLDKVFSTRGRVVIKPNLCSNKSASTGITTHPEVVEAIIDWINPMAESISIVESNVTASKLTPEINFRDCKYLDLFEGKNVKLVNLSKDEQYSISLDVGLARKRHTIAKTLLDTDVIINVPVLKTNNLTALTFGVKNLYGLWAGNKWEFHDNIWDVIDRRTLRINRMIDNMLLDLYMIFKPKLKLTVMDGIIGSDGYWGVSWEHPRNAKFICAGYDLFSVDRVASEEIGVDPSEIAYLKKVDEQGLGSFKEEIIIDGPDPSDIRCEFDLGIKDALRVQDALFSGIHQFDEILKVVDIDEEKLKYLLKGLENFGYISFSDEEVKIRNRLYMNYLLSKTSLVDHQY